MVSGGESYIYLRITDAEGKTFLVKRRIAEDEALLFLSVGDIVTVKALPSETENVYTIVTLEKQNSEA